MSQIRRGLWLAFVLASCLPLAGCLWNPFAKSGNASAKPGRIQMVAFNDPLKISVLNGPLLARGAKNETVQLTLQIRDFPRLSGKKPYTLRLTPFQFGQSESIPASAFRAYQVLPVPIDANRAGFVRHTGLPASLQNLPRALLPLTMEDGAINLASLRNADRPTDPASRADEANAPLPLIWIDIAIPPTVAAGEYQAQCEITEAGTLKDTVPVTLAVDDFVIPDERHLTMVGTIDWAGLVRLYPRQFKGINPSLLTRREDRYAPAIKVLDDIVKLAQLHRTQVVFPRLQPIVKWPSGKSPEIDWTEYDSIVAPWLKGEVFPDLVPLGYWPLPRPDYIDQQDEASRAQYWQTAAAHFDQNDWIARSAISLEKRGAGRIGLAESVELSERAAKLLALNPRLRVAVPLEEEHVQLAGPSTPSRIPAEALDRVLYAAPGLVSTPPMQRLPEGAGTRWLRTDLPGLIPYIGAGADDREVRSWAWLAFLRQAQLIQWPSVLPARNNPAEPADPDELAWFYPGSWFGVDEPVPTLQLKWLRRAQQDYEYLFLARQRGQGAAALALARLLTRPVELQPAQDADQVYALLSGSSDSSVWTTAHNLLTRTILLSQPGQAVDAAAERKLAYEITTWSQGQQRPLMLGRITDWIAARNRDGASAIGLRLGLDIYNAAEQQPEKSRLYWTVVPEAWQSQTPPTEIPQLGTYTINRFFLDNQITPSRLSPASRSPVKITYTDGFTGQAYSVQLMVPVAASDQRLGPPPKIDGSLEDWNPEDALQDGPLVQMLSRPAVQQQQLLFSPTSAAVYSSWSPANLYLAFRLEGADAPSGGGASNFVSYEFHRAWGEDICEFLMQPLYPDNSVGPLLQIVCKPHGQTVISRRLDPRLHASPWQPFAGLDVLYNATLDNTIWRGELAVPWDIVNDPPHRGRKPAFLRFNFIQHRATTGQSASWAGPIDEDREENFTGLLQIRQNDSSGFVDRPAP